MSVDELEEVVHDDGLRCPLAVSPILQHLDAPLIVGIDRQADVAVTLGHGILQHVHLVHSIVELHAMDQLSHTLLGRFHGNHLVTHGGRQKAVVADVGPHVNHHGIGEPLESQLVQLGDVGLPHTFRTQSGRDEDVTLRRVYTDVEPGLGRRQGAVVVFFVFSELGVHQVEESGQVDVFGGHMEQLALAQLSVQRIFFRRQE